ncbi:hypothetical protein [Hallella colorans]|uniref:hypothetical protein n=1 Tax=Hallella colorans TaxID=1703337 RepID=UPI003012B531
MNIAINTAATESVPFQLSTKKLRGKICAKRAKSKAINIKTVYIKMNIAELPIWYDARAKGMGQ